MKGQQCCNHDIHYFQYQQKSNETYKNMQNDQKTMKYVKTYACCSKNHSIFFKKKLNMYRINSNIIVNDIAIEIKKISNIITKIKLTKTLIDFNLILKFIDVINKKQYALTK